MIRTQELIEVINNRDNPVLTEFFDIDVRGLNKFVKPETDILHWSCWRRQGILD